MTYPQQQPGWQLQPYDQPPFHVFAPVQGAKYVCRYCGQPYYTAVHAGQQQYAQQPRRAVTHKPANHVLHLILTVLTCGLWLPVWILAAIKGRREVTKYR